MKMSKRLEDAFNKQMYEEMNSWYIYLEIASWYNDKGLNGFMNWMQEQAEEELGHAKRFRDYLMVRGNQLSYAPVGVGVPKFSGKTAIDGLKKSLEHEQYITKCIADLCDLAVTEKDHGAALFLEWFTSEQEEEEDSLQVILDKMAIIGGDCGSGLLSIDKMLGKRELEDTDD